MLDYRRQSALLIADLAVPTCCPHFVLIRVIGADHQIRI